LAKTPAEFRSAVIKACRFRWYKDGETVVFAGDRGTTVFSVVSGSLGAVSATGPKDAKLTYSLPPGVWSGMVPLFSERGRIAHHFARERTLLAELEEPAIARMLREKPEWWHYFGYLVTEMLEMIAGFATDLTILDSRRRCIAGLLHCGGMRRGNVPAGPVEVRLTQEELSSIACLSRKTANRVLKALAHEGLVSVGYRSITIADPQQLQRVANGG